LHRKVWILRRVRVGKAPRRPGQHRGRPDAKNTTTTTQLFEKRSKSTPAHIYIYIYIYI